MSLILLVDMDYFFAACEELRHPELKDRPLVVGTAPEATKERGVVQTCNYVARSFGIRSAMPTAHALRLKGDLAYLASDEPYYEEMSAKVMSIVRSYKCRTEALSIDEVAVESKDDDYGYALELAKSIKGRIGELGLPCTIGVSTSKVYAKMVCDAYKPNRIGMVRKDELVGFMKDKGVGAILGVGSKTRERLREMGAEKIGDLAKLDPTMLIERFGKFGGELHLIAIGEDRSGVENETDAISIGRERTIGETPDMEVIGKNITELAKEVFAELDSKGMWFGAVGAKVRYADFTSRTKMRKLPRPSDSMDVACNACMDMIREMAAGRTVRKVGIRLAELESHSGQRKI